MIALPFLAHKISHYKAKTIFKKFFIRFFTLFYPLINFFYLPIIRRYFINQIRKLSPNTQVFLITRLDLGHHMLNLHYASLWQKEKGPTAICILTPTFQRENTLGRLISPDSTIICFDNFLSRLISTLFFHVTLFTKTFMRVYGEILTIKTNALYIIDAHPDNHMTYFSGSYHSAFDPNLSLIKGQSDSFIKSYLKLQSYGYYKDHYWKDYYQLYEASSERITHPSLKKDFLFLQKQLKLSRPYFILNINCKIYSNPSGQQESRRRINHPELYHYVIDYLITRGYEVVLQGREEQPSFTRKPHFIDYAHSKITSLSHDLTLYAHAKGVISSKSGSEIFACIFHLPLLTLNYTEPATSIPLPSYRYYFKHPKYKKSGHFLSWKEFLFHPSYFDHGLEQNSEITYEELSREELINATKEFLEHIEKKIPWSSYSSKQKEFKKTLQPFHLDQYLKKGVPCDCYLEENEKKYAST